MGRKKKDSQSSPMASPDTTPVLDGNDQPTTGKSAQPEKFVVTPGLIPEILRFDNLFTVAEGEPIMIVGPTGVGKSLFLILAEKLFRHSKPGKPVVPANCAHFGGRHSDPNIARSELFGIEKGIIPGIPERVGLVEQANGGILILEEIGELPREVQAMLLTFIEDHKYRKVGGEERESTCQIVGATNNTKELREDFRNRFSPFYVPPIHQRRHDILYYFGFKFPELVRHLRAFEVLALLAYNWPGNVREIELIGRQFKQELLWQPRVGGPLKSVSEFLSLGGMGTKLNFSLVGILHEKLYNHNKGSLKFLRGILKGHGMDLDPEYYLPPFRKFSEEKIKSTPQDPSLVSGWISDLGDKPDLTFSRKKTLKKFGLRILYQYQPFMNAYRGLAHYCHYFFQSPDENKNLLDTRSGSPKAFTWDEGLDSPEKLPKVYALEKHVFEALTKIGLPRELTNIPRNPRARIEFLAAIYKTHGPNKFLESLLKEKSLLDEESLFEEELFLEEEPSLEGSVNLHFSIPPTSWDEAMKSLIRGYLKAAHDNQTQAAKLAGLKKSTFVHNIKRYVKGSLAKTSD